MSGKKSSNLINKEMIDVIFTKTDNIRLISPSFNGDVVELEKYSIIARIKLLTLL